MYEVDLKSQVPMYGAEKADWGGPACAQMAMNGYPPGATSCFVSQTDIWNSIQTHNEEGGLGPWGTGWYADPTGVSTTLQNLCPPQHHWIDVSGTDRDKVLYTLFRWMANYRYASLVCVFAHDYWSAIVYYRTSDDPRTAVDPTLESIGCYEPYWTSATGPEVDYKEVDGSVWMTSPYYWGAPCGGFTNPLCGTKWMNKWVGLGEPPDSDGAVQFEAVARAGRMRIEPDEAVSVARAWLAERRRLEPDATERRLHGVRPQRPMVVREFVPDLEKRDPEHDVRCYVVPFGHRSEIDDRGGGLSRMSVVVNAATGRFEELTVFSRPRRYLNEREAIRIAARQLRRSTRELSGLEAELVMRPLRPHVTTAEPAWLLRDADREIYVTQAGLVLGNLQYQTFRGG